MSEADDRKKAAVEFLLSQKVYPKRDDQLTARECGELLGRRDSHYVYAFMNDLVVSGEWDTGKAIDQETNKVVKVWWIKPK